MFFARFSKSFLQYSCFVLFFAAGQASASTFTWIGGNGNWNTTLNWDLSSVPAASDDVVIDGTVIVTLDVAATINSLQLSNGAQLDFQQSMSCSNFDVSGAGTLVMAGPSGAFFLATPCIIGAGNSLNLTGGGNHFIFGAMTVNGALTGSGGAQFDCSDLSINGNFSLSSGSSLLLNGDLGNYGSFPSLGSGSVTFSGGNQSIHGSNSFGSFTKNVLSASTLIIDSGSTQTFSGTLTLNGVPGQLLSLRSNSPGSQFSLDPQGGKSFSYLDVKDCVNVAAAPIDVSGLSCVDSGNNSNWIFVVGSPTPTWSPTSTPTVTPSATRTASPTVTPIVQFSDDFNVNASSWVNGAGAVTYSGSGGGPFGAGDNYISNFSDGTGGAGGKQVMFNQTQWAFSFTAAGVTEIQFYTRTSFATPLPLRVAMDGAGGKICTTNKVTLLNDGQWHLLTVGVNPADFSLAGGASIANTLANPSMFRILSNNAVAFSGQQIVSTIDYDKVTYITIATSTVTPSFSQTSTQTATTTATPSPSASPTGTHTQSASPSGTYSNSPSATPTGTPTVTPIVQFSDDFNVNASSWVNGAGAVTYNGSGGGPFGAGDNYISNFSDGTGGAGGKQVMFNQTQWAFSFTAAGVTEIQFYARTSFATPLPLRVAMDGAGGKICTTNKVTLLNDGQWHLLTVGVNAVDFSLAGGASIANTLANPNMFRILSNNAVSFSGQQIVSTIDFDKFTYITIATSTVTPSFSQTSTQTATTTATPSPSPSLTGTHTQSASPSGTCSNSPSATPTGMPTVTPFASFSDDFGSDSSGWVNAVGPIPYVNGGGGPLGAGDNYISCYSDGTGNPGGKQVMFNQAQWLFSFTAAGVTEIQFYARTSYATPLPIRIGMDSVAGGRIVTTNAVTLLNDGQWHLLTVGVNPADFSLAGGTSIANTLANPSMFRIFASPVVSFGGLQIVSTVDYDKIGYITLATSTVTPSFTQTFTRTVTPSATPTATPSPSASPTGTPTQSATLTDSPSSTLSATETLTPSETPSITAMDSPTQTATPSATATGSPTASPSSSPSGTPGVTQTQTPGALATGTPAFAMSMVGKAALGPVPAFKGQPICLYFESAPSSSRCDIYNVGGDRVATHTFGGESFPCVETVGFAPGLYLCRISVTGQDGGSKTTTQKIIILP